MEEFVIYPKRFRMLMLGFLSLVFVLLGVLFTVLSINGEATLWIGVVGVITLLFFGWCGIYYVKEFINRRPALIISDEGIIDRSSYLGAGLVKWEDIKEFNLYTFSGQAFLGITTYDPHLIIQRTSGARKLLNGMNKSLVDAQVNIPVKNLACPVETIFEEIERRWVVESDVTLPNE